MTSKPRVLAAVDFGTHGTGFAWTITGSPEPEIFYFDQWPGQPVPYLKNLSALLLDPDSNVVEWGFEAQRQEAQRREDGCTYHAHFKMDLHSDDDAGPDVKLKRADEA